MSEVHNIFGKRPLELANLKTFALSIEGIRCEDRGENTLYFWDDGKSTRGFDISLEEDYIEVRNTVLSNRFDYELTNKIVTEILALTDGIIFNDEDVEVTKSSIFDNNTIIKKESGDCEMVRILSKEHEISIFGPVREVYFGKRLFEALSSLDGKELKKIMFDLILTVNFRLPDYDSPNIMLVSSSENDEEHKKMIVLSNKTDYILGKYDNIFLYMDDGPIMITNEILNNFLPLNWTLVDEYTIIAPIIDHDEWEKLLANAKEFDLWSHYSKDRKERCGEQAQSMVSNISNSREIHIDCPNCSQPVQFVFWDIIDINANPELKKKIHDSSIFFAHCPECDSNIYVPYGFVYHDMEQQLVLFFQHEENADYFGNDVSKLLDSLLQSGYRNRIVYGYNKLKEKMLIFDNEQDDLDIELIKYGLVKNYLHNNLDNPTQVYFIQKNDDSYDFYIKENGKEGYERRFSLLECKMAKDSFIYRFETINEGCGFYTIDSKWIENHIEPMPSVNVLEKLKQKYDSVGFGPHCGRIAVKKNGLTGFVDIEGNEMIPPIYRNAMSFSEGMSVVNLAVHKYGLIDTDGKDIIPCKYDNVRSYQNGFARVEKGIYWAVIDENKNFVISFDREYQYIEDFVNGLARVKKGTKWGIINLYGDIIAPLKYYEIDAFKSGLARVRLKPKLYGYIDEKGKEIVPPIYEFIGDFRKGVAVVFVDGKRGLVNKNGEVIFIPENDFIGDFNNDGLAVFGKNKKIGIVNNYGRIIVPAICTNREELKVAYLICFQ